MTVLARLEQSERDLAAAKATPAPAGAKPGAAGGKDGALAVPHRDGFTLVHLLITAILVRLPDPGERAGERGLIRLLAPASLSIFARAGAHGIGAAPPPSPSASSPLHRPSCWATTSSPLACLIVVVNFIQI